MGMFDHVKFQMKCPVCGETIDGFQTKDGNNVMRTYAVNHPLVKKFYSFCNVCGLWVELEKGKVKKK